ncbi:MAG: hypothetical protein IK141_04230, partial [Clostridia bacterium]|nr:hypothetical protein [Clostridia bacterium]
MLHETSCAYDMSFNLLTSQIYYPDENTAVRIQRDLTADHRNVAEEKIYVNDILKRRTTYTYDAYGNVLTSRQYNSGGEDVLTQYTYQDNAYLASRSVS